MSIDKLLSESNQVINLSASERWEVYHRLQSLQIDCQCSTNQPLRVCTHSPNQLLQVWGVLRQVRASRLSLVSWLESCWQFNP
jgi:hypothetical protein